MATKPDPSDPGMAARIAGFDWASTPLGARDGWPAPLRNAVELMLAMPQPAYIAWGDELTSLYNDSYVPVLGDKHPDALGESYHAIWSELSEPYRDALEATLAGEAQFFEDEPMALAGRGCDISWFTFSWTPLRDGQGAVAGFFTVGAETTGKMLGQQALRESEERFRGLVAAAAQAVWEADAGGVVRLDSPSWRAYTGQTVEQWLGRGWLDAVHPEDRDGAARAWDRAVETLRPVDGEFRLRDPDGGWCWTHVRAVPLRDARGQVCKWVGMNIDIDVRRRAEDELRESRARLARELESATLLQTISTDLLAGDGGTALHERLVEAASLLTGSRGASLQCLDTDGQCLQLIASRGFDAQARSYWAQVDVTSTSACGRALADGERTTICDVDDCDFLVGTGDLAELHRLGFRAVQSTPLCNREGRLLGVISTHWDEPHAPSADVLRPFDVLARMAADLLERDESERRVRESESALYTALEAADLGMWSLDLVDGVARHSLRHDQMFGYTDLQPEWTVDVAERHLVEEDRPLLREALERAVHTGVFQLEARVRWPDGSVHWIAPWGRVEYDADGRALRVTGVIADITGQRWSEARYRTLIESLDAGCVVVELIHDANGEAVDFRVLEANAAHQRITGLHPAAIVGQPHRQFIGEEAGYWARLFEDIRGGGPRRFERFVAAYDRWIDVTLCHVEGDRFAALLDDVSDRVYAEQKLRDSEQRLAAIFANASVGLSEVDSTGRFVQVNDELCRILGRTHGEVVGRHVTEVTLGADIDATLDAVARARDTGATVSLDKRYTRPDGSWVWAHSSATRFRASNGLPDNFLVVTMDLSERKAAESAREASEALLRQFSEASSDVLWVRDAHTLLWEYLSPAYVVVYGEPVEAAMSPGDVGHWLGRILEEDRAHALASIDRVRDGEQVTFEYRIRRASDGAVRWLRDTDFPLRDSEGRVQHIGGIGHDVTELKHTEQALAESEHRQRALMEGIPQLVWRSLEGGDWTWSSPQWRAFTGQGPEQSWRMGWLDAVHPDDRAPALSAWEEAGSDGMLDVEFRIRRARDGAWLWHHARSLPQRDLTGNVVEWFGTCTDVQQLKELQEQQQVLVAELQHRTRNLIGVVRSIADRTAASSSSLEAFRACFRDRMGALGRVQGLLSQRETGQRVTFDQLLQAELAGLGVLDRVGPDRQITLDGPDGVGLRSSSVQTFALGLHELATNAVKYGALSGPDGHLAVQWKVEDAASGPRLHVDWRESGVDVAPGSLEPTARRGYGRELIERALPYQLRAETEYELLPDGVHCSLRVPLSRRPSAFGA